ncbi:hypothetical protein [Campylobacter novaezeelandiae]|nr:hypothetical protein [Campylobacter novaezeelandiae]
MFIFGFYFKDDPLYMQDIIINLARCITMVVVWKI